MSENPGLVEALEPVAKVLRSMDVRFYVGGWVASSYHGASRSTLDVDLVADLKRENVDLLVDKLQNEYYLSRSAIIDAIERSSCFNLIHLATSPVAVPKNKPDAFHEFVKCVIENLAGLTMSVLQKTEKLYH
ncbi:MAG: hypothetical protein AAFN77_20530 [Planctomycetota bacterium]